VGGYSQSAEWRYKPCQDKSTARPLDIHNQGRDTDFHYPPYDTRINAEIFTGKVKSGTTAA
jgi:hypothetical protein